MGGALPKPDATSWRRAGPRPSTRGNDPPLDADLDGRVLGGAAEILTINYLLPAPDSDRRGLLFQASILASAAGTTVDPTGVATMTALCDAIVATVRWKRDA